MYPESCQSVYRDFLNGGRMIVKRKKYFEWCHLQENFNFGSSHRTEFPTRRVQIGRLHAVFGVSGNYTWIQLEKSNPCIEPYRHILHWCFSLINRENIGPYGTSVHTESNPIYLC
jgi:hypothetical protein